MNMTIAYDMPTNTTGLMSFAQYIDVLTGGWFWLLFLFLFFVISYVSMSKYLAGKSFIAAAATTALVSLPLAATGLIDTKIPLLLMIFTAAVSFFIHYKKTRSL